MPGIASLSYYKRQQAIRDMFVFMCFSGLAHADLKALSYKNVYTDSDGGVWLIGNRVKTKPPMSSNFCR